MGSARPNGKKDAGLDVEIEVIDPTGAGTVTDSAAAGQGERTTLSGGVGRYLVVVRGYLRAPVGTNSPPATWTYTTLALDQTVDGEIESADGLRPLPLTCQPTGTSASPSRPATISIR